MGDVYLDHMTRLPSEVQRLNDQFEVMTEIMGYIVHPSITLPPAPRIVDMGTGTATFLLRIHPTYPDASLEGYDISTALYPPPSSLSANISLGELDLKLPFPEHMHGKYDLVHVRMLILAMLPEEWEPVVRNLTTLLKPGGYLQWEECEHVHATWVQGAPDSRVEKAKYIGDLFQNSLRGRLAHGWNTLPDHMRAAGLTSVTSDVFDSERAPQIRKRSTVTIVNLVFTWAHMVNSKTPSGSMFNDDLNNLRREVLEEVESGTYLRYNVHVACGRKAPL
ncbi:S-adenosyl-L-methionine-dependent methyltransferase [Nemania sp. NC0429]|nr:S-adenosyl-L-methionine-dependent methyltransferase [Nemania sp. NC0429]